MMIGIGYGGSIYLLGLKLPVQHVVLSLKESLSTPTGSELAGCRIKNALMFLVYKSGSRAVTNIYI